MPVVSDYTEKQAISISDLNIIQHNWTLEYDSQCLCKPVVTDYKHRVSEVKDFGQLVSTKIARRGAGYGRLW